MVVDDTFYMQLCLDEAWKYQALTYPNPPVGALILSPNGQIITIQAHQKVKTSHAELNACIKAVSLCGDTIINTISSPNKQHDYLMKHYQNHFTGYKIYVTLEPCMHQGSTPPCSLLIKTLGFTEVIVGMPDPNKEASGGIKFLENAGIKVRTGILQKACEMLLYPFTKWQKEQNFIFFKLAKHQNGTYTGKSVSCLESRKLVHQIRTTIDLLVIGGDTVRIDRPTLDCRLYDTKAQAPDILIYTSYDNIDRDIPLFKVPNRKVFIANDFSLLSKYRHIMIEGAEGMLTHTQDFVDYYLFFTSAYLKVGKTIQVDFNLKSLHSFKNSSDTIEWFKNDTKENR